MEPILAFARGIFTFFPLALGLGRCSEFFDPKARVTPRPITSERKVRTPQGRTLRQLQGERRRRVSRRGDGQCHRKQTARSEPPQGGSVGVRVKRWGKSPPRQRRRWWQEKPRLVQGKIGGWAARPIAAGMPHGAQAPRPCKRPREMTTEPRLAGGNRIRLTGPKAKIFI